MKINRIFTVGIIVILLGACGGGGGSSSSGSETSTQNTESGAGEGQNSVEQADVTLTGVAIDPVVSDANVIVSDLDDNLITETTTDEEGSFSIELPENNIENGFQIVVSGGQMNGESFQEELRGIYSSNDDVENINVTPLTTLIHQLSTNDGSNPSLSMKQIALETLARIGMINADESNLIEPSTVNIDDLREVVQLLGVQEWVNEIEVDLEDEQLSSQMMRGFPYANGGIVYVAVGESGRVSGLKGKLVLAKMDLGLYVSDSTDEYSFELEGALDGMSVSAGGELAYSVPADAPTAETQLVMTVTNSTTGKSRIVPISFSVLATEIVASGVVGPEGGVIADEWEDIILTVPEGAVTEQSTIQVLRAVDENGKYRYSSTSTSSLKKILRIKVPNAFLQAAQAQNVQLDSQKSRLKPTFTKRRKREESDSWTLWREDTVYAQFIEVVRIGLVNPNNRVRNDLPKGKAPILDNARLSLKDASKIYSLCGAKSDYYSNCSGKDPVVFVHGFSSRGNHGGGEKTWGNLPELMRDEGYAVFEFTWRTTASFKDAAADLARAIAKINNVSGKKVHIVAHSFGGLMARTYLQGWARNSPYNNNVQSLLTLGTPHSGIFDSDTTYTFEIDSPVAGVVDFPKGQEAFSFEFCLQSSCNQAGQPTEPIWSVLSDAPSSCYDDNGKFIFPVECQDDWDATPKVDISDDLGITQQAGELPALLTLNTGEHAIPVKMRVLMGLTIDRSFSLSLAPDQYESGDALISYAGQRFTPDLGNVATTDANVNPGGPVVTEKVLGANGNQSNAYPGGSIDNADSFQNSERINFEGYRHADGNVGLGTGLFTARGDVGIAYVKNADELSNTGSPHEAYEEVKNWLSGTPSEQAEPEVFPLNIEVKDALTKQPIANAFVIIALYGDPMAHGETDAEGNLSLTVLFYPEKPYVATVVHDRLHWDEFDLGYVTASTVYETEQNYPVIEMQPVEVNKGILAGNVFDYETDQAVSGVSVIIDNGIVRTTVTDSDGLYSMPELVIGNYKVTFEKDGYISRTDYFNVYSLETNFKVIGLEKRDLSTSLVAYYPFDGNANDASGNGNTGEENGGVTFVDGINGQAANFDGVDDYIELPASVISGTEFSVGFWLNRQGVHDGILSGSKDESHNEFTVYLGSMANYELHYNSSLSFYQTGLPSSQNEWQHFLLVRSEDQSTIYIDGISSWSVNHVGGQAILLESLFLGAEADCVGGCFEDSQYFNGSIDSLYIYNRVLNDVEIEELFQRGGSSSGPPPPGKLNDTGITWGGNYPEGNNATCTGEAVGQQDCSHGRDATHNDDSDGHAGFSFTKLDVNGIRLIASATEWACVLDNVTGFVWEVKATDGGIHDASNTYRWGGKGADPFGTEFYADWDVLVDGSNTESLCGYSDWRVPRRNELVSIVDYGQSNPAIDSAYFPNINLWNYWSASASAYSSDHAWYVYFDYGNPNNYLRGSRGGVRLVRGGQ